MYYNSLNNHLRGRFGRKVYRLALSSGCTCPTRDGLIDTRGCIFCDGSGSFAAAGSIASQLDEAKARVRAKAGENPGYIAYFQSYTNTYGDPSRLRGMFMSAIEPEDVVALSVATRPDCLPEPILQILHELALIKPVWVELGLQTVHESTVKYIRRGYPTGVYREAVDTLHSIGCEVVAHQILGLPGESIPMMAETSRYIGESGADGVKLHLLHIIRDTDLAREWAEGRVKTMTLGEYIDALEACLRVLPPEIVIHRMTGDGDKRTLLAPLWSADKKRVLNEINRRFTEDNLIQGSALG